MPPGSIVEFIARCLLILVLTVMSQLPASLGVKVDADAFLGSFYYFDSDMSPKRVSTWSDGPGWRSQSSRNGESLKDIKAKMNSLDSQEDHLVIQRRIWEEHQNRCGAHIPSALCCVKGITPLEGWDGRPIRKMMPLLFPDRPKKLRKKKKRVSNNEGTIMSLSAELPVV